MNDPIKFLFDENFGEPLVSALAGFLTWYKEHPVEIRHLFRFAKSGEKDEVWVPRIASGGWVVVSTDKGRRCGGKKLAEVCRAYKVTHVLLSTGIQKSKHFEKVRAVLAVWPRMILAAQHEKGTTFSLRYEGVEKRVVLVESLSRTACSSGLPRLGFDGKKRKGRMRATKRNVDVIPEFEFLFAKRNG